MNNALPDLFEPARAVPAPEGMTVRDAARMLFKHKWIILFCALLAAGLAAAALLYLPRTYVADAKVLVKTDLDGGPVFYSGISAYREGRDADPPNRKLETEISVLTARALSEDVVRSLGLGYKDVHHSPLKVLSEPLLEAWDRIERRWLGGEPQARRTFDDTVSEFNQALAVQPVKSKGAETTSNVLHVTLRGPDRELTARALGALVEKYTGYLAALNLRSGDEAMKVVTATAREAEARVEQAQGRLSSFLAERGVVLARGNPAQAYAAGEDEPLPDGMRSAAAGGSRAALPSQVAFGDDGVIGALKMRLTQLELTLAQQRLDYTDDSQRVVTLRRQIAQIKQRVLGETRRNAQNEAGFMTLQRDLRIAEEGYLDVKKRMGQIALFLQMKPSQADSRVVMDPPRPPRESDFKLKLAIWLAAAAAGLLIGLAAAGLLETTDHRLQSSADVQRFLGLETLAMVNFARRRAARESIAGMRNAALRLCAKMNRHELQGPSQKHASVILVTSARRGEGKATVARTLAQELARVSGRRVVLIDANLERPVLHREFGLPQDGGFSDGLANGWERVRLHEGPVPGLHIMTAGSSTTALQVQHGADPITRFRDHVAYQDAVVVLSGPSLTEGGLGFAERVDGIVLVIDSARTRREVVNGVLDGLGIERHKVLGAVLSNWKPYIPRFLYRYF